MICHSELWRYLFPKIIIKEAVERVLSMEDQRRTRTTDWLEKRGIQTTTIRENENSPGIEAVKYLLRAYLPETDQRRKRIPTNHNDV